MELRNKIYEARNNRNTAIDELISKLVLKIKTLLKNNPKLAVVRSEKDE